ncbi:MAG TPA: hypothetical protein PKZ32_12125 [Candidatus Melainabacteria bacterium]|nr:hypothetical protein [Candidatus Melainabacteria bacterium]
MPGLNVVDEFMDTDKKKEFLIERLFSKVVSCVEGRDFYAARLYQRDLILLMTQTGKYSHSQIADAYFALAEFCAKVGDFKAVNRFTTRATKYKSIGSQGNPSALSKFFQTGNIVSRT